MIRILLTGVNGRIGNAFEEYIKETCPDEVVVDRVSVRGDEYLSADWTGYDALIHAAGVVSAKEKSTAEQEEKYCNYVNRDITLKVAGKAKESGVKRFIFLSTMMVYGESAPIGRSFTINRDTRPAPLSAYGKSKLAAEEGLKKLENDDFRVIIIRESVVYGEHFLGEFYKLQCAAGRLPVFPKIDSTKSYIYERNLCELLKLMATDGRSGVYCPQNREIVTTSELFVHMRRAYGKRCVLIAGLRPVLKLLSYATRYVNATFNDMKYAPELSDIAGTDYRVYSLEESIVRCLK